MPSSTKFHGPAFGQVWHFDSTIHNELMLVAEDHDRPGSGRWWVVNLVSQHVQPFIMEGLHKKPLSDWTLRSEA